MFNKGYSRIPLKIIQIPKGNIYKLSYNGVIINLYDLILFTYYNIILFTSMWEI